MPSNNLLPLCRKPQMAARERIEVRYLKSILRGTAGTYVATVVATVGEINGYGRTPAEAVGKLLMVNQAKFGLEVNVILPSEAKRLALTTDAEEQGK